MATSSPLVNRLPLMTSLTIGIGVAGKTEGIEIFYWYINEIGWRSYGDRRNKKPGAVAGLM